MPWVVCTTKSPGFRSARSAANAAIWLLLGPGRATSSEEPNRSSDPMKAMADSGNTTPRRTRPFTR